MTETPSIEFQAVWKRFRKGQMHDSLRDLLPAIGRRLLRRGHVTNASDFWALRDISFRVDPGEVLGIIGGNGAGKSTTLKILTKIMRPTAGAASVKGRIGALIEVSAGFHQDLTGRENVFLQGSIMGMTIAMIKQKFDEIVEFAGLADFIDTPVKRYSSGMNARLGFSIAAHLDPEVLIIDEVLSVGDFRFQEKAFNRIHEMSQSGIPVVLVSHQLDRVSALCTKAIALDQGVVLHQGKVSECIDAYLSGGPSLVAHSQHAAPIRFGAFRFLGGPNLRWGEQAELELDAFISGIERESFDSIGVRIRSLEGGREIFMTNTRLAGIILPARGMIRCRLSLRVHLPRGSYTVEPFAFRPGEDHLLCDGPIATCHIEVPALMGRGTVELEPRFDVSLLPESPPAEVTLV